MDELKSVLVGLATLLKNHVEMDIDKEKETQALLDTVKILEDKVEALELKIVTLAFYG